jgi:hypothetical protein
LVDQAAALGLDGGGNRAGLGRDNHSTVHGNKPGNVCAQTLVHHNTFGRQRVVTKPWRYKQIERSPSGAV